MSSSASTLPLENISQTGQVPKSRIGDASDGQALVQTLVEANRQRSLFNSKIKGMFQGMPPYDQGKLQAAGQGYRANINFREGKAARSAALVPYYDLFSAAKFYAQVRTNQGGDQNKQKWSDIITEEFDTMLKSYAAFDFNMQKMLADLVGYGSGFLVWKDKTDWHFKCAPRHKMYVPDGTDACMDELEVLVYRERMRVNVLWGYIQDKKAAKDVGWNVDATVEAIASAFPETREGTNQYNYEWVQQKLKDRDLTEGARSSTVPVAHILSAEFDGTVTHQIVFEVSGRTKGQKDTKAQFIYEKKGRFSNFRQFCAGFFLETLDGSWNGVEGIGHDIYSTMAIKDRLKCSTIDQVFLKCGVTLQAKTASALQKTSLVQAGVFNIIPPDYDVQQATILGDSNSPLVLDRQLDNMLMANTGVYRQRVQKEDGNPITAEQARIDQQNSTVLSNSAVNRFYQDLDHLYAEIYRRASDPNLVGDGPAIKAAKGFQERCKARGVEAVAIKDVECVTAYRNAGNGSAYMRQQNINSTMPIFPLLPEQGKQNFIDYSLAAIHGQSMVDVFNPKGEEQRIPGDQRAWAMLENAAMKENAPVAWTSTQNNVVHAQIHLQSAAQAAQSLQQGADQMEVLSYLEAIGKHTAIHLQKLQGDPFRKDVFQVLQQQWEQLAKFTDQLMKKVQDDSQQQQENQAKMAQAQAVQQGTDPDTQIKLAKAQQDMQIKQAKAAQQLQHKDQKTAQDIALKNAKAISDEHRANQQSANQSSE